ncbi:sensor histidine kinase [Rurimicrobium arvi]|uniref:histidine kinase n=1 Tax=Rurimicrobium arvi TaxID=2049916 RepID=A0ABP8MEU6_9BACT
MLRTIKAKIALGIGVLFVLLLTLSVIAFVFINRISHNTENLLDANYKTIRYCSQMSYALNTRLRDSNMRALFADNLCLQEQNITEKGEREATQQLRLYFELLKKGMNDSSVIDSANKFLLTINRLNQHALEYKNAQAMQEASSARLWVSIITAVLILISFTLAVNFPDYIAGPVRLLTEGITEIAQKNYSKRIYLDNKDEFGEMAAAFNTMAEKLYDYENSSINQVLFEKQRVETIINQMNDGVIGLDAKGRVLFINVTAQHLLHLTAQESKGRYAPDLALKNDLLRMILQNEPGAEPLKIIVDGKEHYFSIDNRSVHTDDQSIGEVFMLRNITSFKELDISKTNLLATISHELKTPIASIKMSLKLLSDQRTGSLNTEQQEMVMNVQEDAERLLRLTSELLNMTQIETGNIQLKLQKVAASDIVVQALKTLHIQAEEKKVEIAVSVAEHIPLILIDADKTSWVLINLLGNAIKYSTAGGLVRVEATYADRNVMFSVRDNGPGIDDQYAGRVFERYFKIPGNELGGSGLGLAIAKEFIEAQGGTVSFRNLPEGGSVFSFSLPAAI